MVSSVVLKDMNRMGLYLSFIDYKSIFLCVTYLFIKFYVINPQNSPGTCIIHWGLWYNELKSHVIILIFLTK